MPMTRHEMEDFRQFCHQATNAQLDAIVEKEESAHGEDRMICAAIARDVRDDRNRIR